MDDAQTKNRLVPMAAGAVAQISIGFLYIWGVFQPYVQKHLNLDPKNAALVFSFALVFFSFGNIVGGKFQNSMPCKMVCLIGGIMMGGGIALSALAPMGSYLFLYVTFGIIAGLGSGISYNAIISCSQKWYPDKMGLATGIAVATPGIGGIFFAPLMEKILSTAGVQAAFVSLGVLILILAVGSFFFISSPPEGYLPKGYTPNEKQKNAKDYTAGEMIKTPAFYALLFSMFFALPANLMILPLIKDIGAERGLSVAAAVLGVSAASFFNSLGRLVYPWLSDIIGRKNTILLIFVITIASVGGLVVAQGYWVLVLICVVAFCYGGCLGTYPAITSEYFGQKYSGLNYGLVLIGFAGASIAAPYTAGIIKEAGAGYGVSFMVVGAAALVGLVIAALIRKPKES